MEENVTNEPLVSIMMTAFNRAKYTDLAIKSVLAQTYQNWELLVLDDGSTDGTDKVVTRLVATDRRIKNLRSEENLGITRNRNRGFNSPVGKYVAVLDCDDLWIDPDKLKLQVTYLEEHPDHVIVGTDVTVIDANGDQIGSLGYLKEDHDIRRKMLVRNQFTHSAVLMRSEAIPMPRPYDESGVVSIWEDYDLILRLGIKGQMANIPRQMTAYRLHSSNVSKAHKKSGALAHLRIIRRYKTAYHGYVTAVLKGYIRLLLAWI